MNKIFSTLTLTVILLFLLSFKSLAISYEPNDNQQSVKISPSFYSDESKQNTLHKTLLSYSGILLGFILGLSGTIVTDYFRRRRQAIEYRKGVRTELKQALAVLGPLATNIDANITVEKFRLWLLLSDEFKLHKEICPLMDDPFEEIRKKGFNGRNDEHLQQFVKLHNTIKSQRETEDNYQSIKKINCKFATNNMTFVSLLKKSEISLVLNILRRIDIINELISKLEFVFEKTYDNSVSPENRKRLKVNYLQGCQLISDWSYETSKEIACLLRK